jgi:hypothetical protein
MLKKVLKLWENCYFNYSFYLHPEIRNLRVWRLASWILEKNHKDSHPTDSVSSVSLSRLPKSPSSLIIDDERPSLVKLPTRHSRHPASSRRGPTPSCSHTSRKDVATVSKKQGEVMLEGGIGCGHCESTVQRRQRCWWSYCHGGSSDGEGWQRGARGHMGPTQGLGSRR